MVAGGFVEGICEPPLVCEDVGRSGGALCATVTRPRRFTEHERIELFGSTQPAARCGGA